MKASIIIVDSSVANYQTLLQGANTDAEVVILDTERSGIEQITETLANSQDIAQLHLLSHGSAGSLYLGGDIFNTENLEKFSSQIKEWGKSLTKNAEIFLYGCQVAATATGKTFVDRLHQLTKANIAASEYPVGNPKKGGTWNLEYSVGNITSPIAFSPEVCAAYPGIFGASFGTASNFPVGSGARSIAVKDFNEDGQLDMAVVNEASDDVSVLLGSGAGSFGAATNLAVGDLPLSVAAGDFNGDGNQDMAVANYNSSTISVFLGNGAGGFGSPSTFTGGASPRSVAVGDFDSDGKLDMVTANRNSGNVTVLLGNGAGSFGAATGFAVGSTPLGVVVGDFNGDSKQDLAVVKYGSNDISVLLNDGSGSFSAATNFTVGTDPRSVALGDFNSDGKQDMAVANFTSNNVSVLLGNGAGSFGAATNFAAGTGSFSVAVVDSNLDGKQDIAVANGSSGNVSVLLGNGAGSFGAATNFGVGAYPTFITSGDLNSDGKSDLAVANGGASNNVSVLLNTFPTVTLAAGTTPSETGPTNGTFTITLDQPAPTGGLTVNYNTTGSTAADPAHYSFDQPTSTNITAVTASTFTIAAGATTATLTVKPVDDSILNPGETVTVNLTASPDYILGPTSGATVEFSPATYSTGTNPLGIAVGDFNSDGNPDMVTANRGSGNVSVLLGNGAGNFGAPSNLALGGVPSQVQVGDFNGDGKQDIVVSNFSGGGGISVLLGNGSGGFAAPTNFSIPNAFALGAGDFNGDGKLDVAVGRYNTGIVSILLGNGSGGFGAATDYTVGTFPSSIATADFNSDGKQDMAVANKGSANISVLLGNGAGGFGAPTNFAAGTQPSYLAAGDFNGDGKLDLTTANYGSNNISVLLGNGSGGFGAATNLTAGTQPYGVVTADINGDGKLDIAASSANTSNISVLLGNGSGGFGAATNFSAGTRPTYLAAGDFNIDGKSDIAIANILSNNVSVLLNNNQPTATLTITDNDNVEIDLQGNSTSIADGDTTPSLTDHTDFGSATITPLGSVTRTFTITNTGPDPLTLIGTPLVSISGANAADFTVTATPAATVGSSSQTTFQITFTPSALGVRTADIAIGSNDNDENPYNFTIQGTGTSIPTLSNITKTGNEDNNITFIAADFTNAYSDADGDPLNKIKITSLPANGTLQLSGTNVTLNQEITAASIPNLTFTPTADYNGSSSFTWNGSDGTNYATSDATANLTVNPINDAPSFSNAGNQTLTNWTNTAQTVTGWANNFVFGPTNENTQTVADFLVNVTSGSTLFTTLPDIANDGTLTYTPTGEAGTATVSVQLQDDGGVVNGGVDTSTASTFTIIIPPPTVNLTVDTTTGTEAGTTAITLTATAQGAVVNNQTLNLALTGTALNTDFSGTIPTQITIADGSNSGQVTVTVANDLIDEDNETATFTISNPSSGIQLGTTTAQTITITDDDTAGYDITGISGDTSEFGSLATFDIKLTSQPTATVTLNFTSSDTSEGTVIPTVTFDATNWNVPQTITITGVDDAVADGNITYSITGTATSTDAKYNNNNPTSVAVINTDNDIPGVTVIQTGGNTELTEAGITDSYTIQLNTLPTSNVQITATADAQTEISLDGVNFAPTQTLTFTSTNGMTPQTVTVRAIDDTTPEDYHSGGITHAISNSADANYPTTMTVGDINPHITDNDISYSLTGSSTTVTEGNSGTQQITYNITRTGAISETSTVDFNFSGTAANTIDYNLVSITGTGVTTSGSTITFAPNATISTITVEVVGDQIDEDNKTLEINLSNPTATGTASLIGSPTTTTITDDDTAGFIINPTSGLTTSETGLTSSFDVHLTSQPTANVSIGISSSNTAEGTIDKNSLTFTAANWSTPQTVTITGVDELVDDGNIAYNIITAPATSTDVKYNGINATDIAVSNINNDTAGITITPTSGLTTTEVGGTATFTVQLNSQPTANVSIGISSSNTAEGTIDKNSLTFTAANWNTPQPVTITGVDDLVDDGNIAYNIITAAATSTDAKYNGINADDVAVTNIDNDIAGVTITQTGGNTQLTEGSITDTYSIALNTLPIGNVQITATADPQTQVSLDGVNFAASQTLTFTPTNGMTAQTVTVRAIDDNTTENIHSGTITNAISNSADANYATTLSLDSITANITDNDISYSLTGGSANITEGNSGTQQLTYNITRTGALNETSTVDFNFSGTATNIADYKLVSVTGTGVTASGSTITFAPNATTATITAEIVGEQIDEDNETLILSLVNPTATGTTSLIGSPITTTITDDDTAGFTITPTSGLTTTEAAGNTTFTVALNTQPTADVKINLSSDNTAEGILDKPSLTFNASNWNQPQTVTVTGVDDFGDDGDIPYNIITSAATSTDTKYNGINPLDVAVTNTDNDTAGVALSTANVAAYEGGAGGSYTAVLTSKPTAPVTVNFNGGRQINPLPAITFDSSNWNIPQPVTVTAIDDIIAEGLETETISHTVTSADAKYNGVTVGTVTATITDNDTAAAPVVQPLGRMDVRESGGEDVYKLFLTTQPTATVNVAIVTDGQTTANVPYLTFTPDDWNKPQLVRVSAVDDNVVEGPHTSNITFVASSADGFYQGLPIGGIVANIADNDNVGLVRSLPTPGSVMGTGADDNLVGSAGDDVINARNGNNRVDGGAGNDVLSGGSGADYIAGGAGLDQILSGPGEDYVAGGDDDDVIFAGTGSDRLYGGSGNDKLFGEQGNDYLCGEGGVDTLTGGVGRDAFAVANGFGGMTVAMADVITDFVPGEDVIDLIPALGFGDLSMVQNGADAVIKNGVTGEFLALVQGVDVSSLSPTDFV